MTKDEIMRWLFHVLQVLVLGGGGYLLKVFVDKRHKKDILRHQESLSQHTELLKHELYKVALKAELFTKSQHNIYPAIYEKIVIALGEAQAMEQTGLALGSFDGFSEEELKEMVNNLHLPNQFKDEILAFVPAEQKNAFEKYREYVPLHLANCAQSAIQGAMNEWMKKELYFGDNTNKIIQQVLGNLKSYAGMKKLRLNSMYARGIDDEGDKKLRSAEKLMENLKHEMLNEIQGQRCSAT